MFNNMCVFTENCKFVRDAFQAVDVRRSGGQLGPRNSTHQHFVSEGSSHVGIWQGLESENGFQAVSGLYTSCHTDSIV